MGIEYFTKSVSLDSEVWEALGVNALSANQLLRVALGLDKSAEPSKRRLSRLERLVEARAASDLTAQAVGRDEIDYSDTESVPMTHVTKVGAPVLRPTSGRKETNKSRFERGIREKGDKGR
jgi:hypothetical protein